MSKDFELILTPQQMQLAQLAASIAAGMLATSPTKPGNEHDRWQILNDAITMSAELMNAVVYRTTKTAP